MALQITGRMGFLHRMCVYIGGIDFHQKLNFEKSVTYGVSEKIYSNALAENEIKTNR